LFGVEHPVALAPMGGSAGGALAAAMSNGGVQRRCPTAVSNGGGLGPAGSPTAGALAAALALAVGAAGALVGTRFLATAESLADSAQ
jgi:nitronate monooxygenase